MAEFNTIYDCLVYIQGNLKAPKTQYNSFGKYKYRKAEDILEAVKPHLAKTGCVLTIFDELVLIGDRYYVKSTARLANASDAVMSSAYAREADTKTGMDAAQVTGAASSYARKYALNGLFCIDDTADPDVTNTHNSEEAVKEAVTYINSLTTMEQMRSAWEYYAPYYGDNKTFNAAFVKHQKEISDGTR